MIGRERVVDQVIPGFLGREQPPLISTGPAGAIEAELCRELWLSAEGRVPADVQRMLDRNECIFALLLLLENRLGPCLLKWRIAFDDNGSAYTCRVWVRNGLGGTDEYEGFDESSMVRSMTSAVQQAMSGARTRSGAKAGSG
jgi:hypothetical protein